MREVGDLSAQQARHAAVIEAERRVPVLCSQVWRLRLPVLVEVQAAMLQARTQAFTGSVPRTPAQRGMGHRLPQPTFEQRYKGAP